MSEEDAEKRPSERSFGITFAAVLAVACMWWAYTGRLWPAAAAIAVAAILAAAALVRPSLLIVPNRLWFRLGMALNKVVSPIVLGAMFFVLVTPVGLVRRALGADPLRLKHARGLPTYWVKREGRPAGEKPFAHQF